MIMKKVSLYLVFSSFVFCLSCSQKDKIEEIIGPDEIQSFSVSVPPLEVGDQTRSNIVFSGTSYSFQWEAGDVIGIVPNSGDQLSFTIGPESDGKETAAFDGGGWSMKASYTYTAYSPFSKEMFDGDKLSQVPVSYIGQKQLSNGGTNHLGKFDYLVSEPQVVAENGGISFSLKRISAIVGFVLTLPDAGTFSQLRLISNDAPFTVKGTYDARNGNRILTTTETANVMTLSLDNVQTTESNKTLTAYMLIAPGNYTGKTWTISVLTSIVNGAYDEYTINVGSTNWTPNYFNRYTRPRNSSDVFTKTSHPASEYPYPPQDADGITGSAPDFIPVGGSTNQPD